ncbi:MAG: hypothetical protein HYU38_08230 [Candidatus Tectomicrobia bacterium]|nr:hypothetical protein [Candidatus Tectomicrobia bacterium]
METLVLDRNVRLYPGYAALFSAYFWMPVFFLYFSARFTLEEVLRLEAIYYAAVVLLEVPSGYFSDVHGRKRTLLISAVSLAAAYALFIFGQGFAAFALAQAALAAGIAFNSGTDTSFHFDSLAALGREGEYEARESIAARNSFWAGGLAALLGGAAGALDMRLAYALSLLGALGLVGLVAAMTEPTVHQRKQALGANFLLQMRGCLGCLRSPFLLWLFLFSVLMVVLNHIPYEFYQPYLRFLAPNWELFQTSTPLVAGAHMAASMLVGSWFAARSTRWRRKAGLGIALLSAVVLQVLVIGAMGLLLHPLVAVFILLRSTPRDLMTAPLNAAVMPRIPQARRATYLSMQSLAGRLAFSGFLLFFSWAAGSGAPSDWPSVSLLLRIGSAAALLGLIGLAVTMKRALRDGV